MLDLRRLRAAGSLKEVSRSRRAWDAALEIFAVAAAVVTIAYCWIGD